MTWLPSMAIGGLILAAGPIIIHLLFRRRFRIVEFAPFRLLLQSRRRVRQRIRLEELLLILLRVLACCLLGLLLADIRSSKARVGGAAPTAHVFVLDDSLSMGRQIGGATLYRKAVDRLRRMAEDLGEQDVVAVLSASRPRSGEPIGQLTDIAGVRRGPQLARLAESRPTDLRADMPGALKAAADLVAAVRLPARIHVLSDFRRPDFTDPEPAAALRAVLATLDRERVRVSLLDFGLAGRNNLAVERVTAARGVIVAGVTVPMQATVRNAGLDPTPAARLEIAVGEAVLPVQPVPSLAPGDAVTVDFPCSFPAAGCASVRVSLPPDDLPADSVAWLAVEVQDALRVLIVDGSADPTAPDSPSFALAHALDPSGRGSFGRRVEVMPASAWNPTAPSHDVVILANVRDFPSAPGAGAEPVYPALVALEAFVRAGGGLAVFCGDAVLPSFYNGPFHAGGRGLSPLVLAGAPVPPPDPGKFLRLNPESLADEPMLRTLSSRGANFSRFLRFYSRVAAAPPDESAPSADRPRILARFDDGSPALCRRAFGRGAVLMWYSSADTRWSNWPREISFLPVMNEMVWSLARPADVTLDDVTGRTFAYALPARLSGAVSATLKTPAFPEEDLRNLPLQEEAGSRTVSCAESPYAGLYEIAFRLADRSEHRVLFSRHPDPRESDPAPAAEAELRAIAGDVADYTAGLATGAEPAAAVAAFRSLWWMFLLALAAVLTAENYLGLRFGHYLKDPSGHGHRPHGAETHKA